MITLSSGEIDFIRLSIENNCRTDGRTKLERTPIEIAYGDMTLKNSNGGCKLKLPDTNNFQLISAKAELEKPENDSPNAGKIELQISSSKLSELSVNKANYLRTKMQDMTTFLNNGLLNYAPLKKLELKKGSLAWKIYLDIFVLGELDYNHLDYQVKLLYINT